MSDASALRDVSLFRDLPAEVVDRLEDATERRAHRAGTALVREGEPGDDLIVIVDGHARVVVQGRPRRDLGPGDVVGEIALLDGGARSATVYAVDDVEAVHLAGAAFRGLLEDAPAVYPSLLTALARRLRSLEGDRWAADEERRLRGLQETFLANIGHELRTPLTSALGFVRLARTTDLPADKLESILSTVERGLRGLHQLLEDLLSVTALRRQRNPLELDRYPVGVLVEAAVHEADVDSERLAVELPEDVELVVDGAQVTRILACLLDNARKFGPPGGTISVTGRRTEDLVEVDVSDEGPGVPVEEREAMFALFHQRDPSATRSAGGLGVGLALARSAARLHRGDLRYVEDAASTTFRLVLPTADADLTSTDPSP